MQKRNCYIIISLIIFFFGVKSYAQLFPNLYFENITTKDGLSSNDVKCVTQDKDGIIWIGTINGLNRYDGYRFKKYYHSESDTNSILQNDVRNIFCDSKNRLWLNSYDGLTCYNIIQNTFIKYKQLKQANVFEDHKHTIWVANQDTVLYEVMGDNSLQKHPLKNTVYKYDNSSVRGYKILYEDDQNQFWGVAGKRIYKLDNETKQPIKYFDIADNLPIELFSIQQDVADKKMYWVNGWGGRGLYKFNSTNGSFTITGFKNKKFAIVKKFIQNWQYQNGRYNLIVDLDKGFCITDNGLKDFNWPYDENPIANNLTAPHYENLFVDKNNSLWLSTENGIFKCNGNNNLFKIYSINKPGEIDIVNASKSPPIVFCETDSSYFIARAYQNIYELNKQFQLANSFKALNKLLEDGTTKLPFSLYPFVKELYISTVHGIIIYNRQTMQSTFYAPFGSTTKQEYYFGAILPFSENKIIVRTRSQGFFVFNMLLKKFEKHYAAIVNENNQPYRVTGFIKTSKDIIYATTSMNGMYKFSNTADSFIKIVPANNSIHPLEKEFISSITEDKEGKIWIATNGIIVYNPVSNLIEKKITEDGKMYGVTKILFDKNGGIWANSPTGIWHYTKEKSSWIQYDNSDGLLGDDFQTMLAATQDGKIIAGISGGLAVFNSSDNTSNHSVSYSSIITELTADKNIFSLAGNTPKNVTLPAGTNSFTVNFLVVNYNNPASTRYYYRLSPLMKDFKENENGQINFNGLSHGTYTLTVKGGDKWGNKFEQTDSITIIIKPHWYETDLFKAFLILLTSFAIYYFVKRRIKIIRKEALLKQKMIQTEMQALRAQMNPHFIFNCLNSIENFIMQNKKRLASDYLNKFSRLIRSILDSSRDELIPIDKDMESLKLYLELEQLRFNNKFTCSFYTDPQLINGDYKIPSLIIQPYVENAIVHGFAHSDDDNLKLQISTTLENDMIVFTILDNGIGRKKAMDYNLYNKPNHKSVGLNITKERIAYFNNDKIKDAIMFTDLINEQCENIGTKVVIKLKTI